jgi:hypothetical protein
MHCSCAAGKGSRAGSQRTDRLTCRAKVINGDADQLHGIDAPELDQTFWSQASVRRECRWPSWRR